MQTRLIVKSQRNRVIPDAVRKRVRRRFHAGERWVDYPAKALKRRNAGIYVIDADRGHHFEVTLEFDGFLPLVRQFHATSRQELQWTARNRVERLPRFGELKRRQRDLAGMLPATGSAEDRWKSLSDNQAATFYQVTVALTGCGGGVLADHIRSIARVGGAELRCPANGKTKTVDGWRIHVDWKAHARIERVLSEMRFERGNWSHSTHSTCGYVTSYRESSSKDPKLQIVLNRDGSGADIDLDVGWMHRSAPYQVYEKLIDKYDGVASLFKVNCE